MISSLSSACGEGRKIAEQLWKTHPFSPFALHRRPVLFGCLKRENSFYFILINRCTKVNPHSVSTFLVVVLTGHRGSSHGGQEEEDTGLKSFPTDSKARGQ